ncbi:MAG: AI-2E family transporter [Lachnospiraceae bacterium]|nr:AI-2E family transporter [Lachnospiraceae bacterium]
MEFNKKNVRIIAGLIVFTVVLVAITGNIPGVLNIFRMLVGLVVPFVVGASIAFIINVPMAFFEEKVYGKIKLKYMVKVKRILALITTLIILALVVFLVGFLLVPEIINTAKTIASKIPGAASKAQEWLVEMGINNEQISKWLSGISMEDWKTYLEKGISLLQKSVKGVFFSAVGIVSGTVGVIFDTFVAVVFAIYILFQKEKLASQGKQIIYAFLNEEIGDKIVEIMRLSYKTFKNFLTGQCMEAAILGLMFFITMLIFRMPYALLISVLIAVTALIPIFGAFIGCGVGIVLIIFVDPIQALWFVIMFLILQQIEGNLIYPHVVGNSVGLPSIWVLVAVSVGGSLFGVIGMLVFIPLTSVMYVLFRDYVKVRLVKKEVPHKKWME